MIDLRLDVPFHPALAFELTTKGGATDFALVIAACESFGPYCLIRGLGVNCYVEPVYTLDADIVAVAENLAELSHHLRGEGFVLETFQNSVNARRAGSELRIQFTTDPRYQAFIARAEEHEVLGLRAKVACREDVTQGKLWGVQRPKRPLEQAKEGRA